MFIENENKIILSRQTPTTFFTSREEPDGEESTNEASAGAVAQRTSTVESIGSVPVKVPRWILAETGLSVLFNERAESDLAELNVDKVTIKKVFHQIVIYINKKFECSFFRTVLSMSCEPIHDLFICAQNIVHKYLHFKLVK